MYAHLSRFWGTGHIALKFDILVEELTTYVCNMNGYLYICSLHVRALFRISGTAGRIVLKFGVGYGPTSDKFSCMLRVGYICKALHSFLYLGMH